MFPRPFLTAYYLLAALLLTWAALCALTSKLPPAVAPIILLVPQVKLPKRLGLARLTVCRG